MANVTLKVSRSDVFPVGQSVSVFPTASGKRAAGKPSGTAITSATVDAAGLLTFTIPAKTGYLLYAEVAGEHRGIRGGDPTSDAPLPTLRERLDRQKALVGV